MGARVTGFTTFLTGELFNLFSTASLLRHSVDPAARITPDDADFLQACRDMIESPDQLPARLFSIRAASLLQGLTPPRASAVLSGMLIGAEIGAARKAFTARNVVLVGSGRLGQLYERGARHGGLYCRAGRRGKAGARRASCGGALFLANIMTPLTQRRTLPPYPSNK